MGYYVNPRESTKEEWLNNHGLEITGPEWALLTTNFPGINPDEGGGVYVCLVDNGPYTAAAIAYNEQEFDVFCDTTHDHRPRTWYVVPREDIIEVCPEVAERLS